jgi:diguanylate cyclase (GGDEF)-like protein
MSSSDRNLEPFDPDSNPGVFEELREQVRQLRRELAGAKRALRSLRARIGRDPLTGVPDRGQADAWLQAALSSHEPIACLLVDLDGFKDVNAALGHTGGDIVLREAAALLERALPRGARLARYGGDEFLVLAPSGSEVTAVAAAEAFRSAFEVQRPPSGMTLSIGATVVRSGDSTENVIQRADQALSRAKAAGKDRVEVEL